jgi:hypothetical protein
MDSFLNDEKLACNFYKTSRCGLRRIDQAITLLRCADHQLQANRTLPCGGFYAYGC